jgi:hypothetical protein
MKSHSMLLGVVGVNVAASIPLVLAPQAMASDSMSSTANFLKAAVAEKATAHSLTAQSSPTLRAKPLSIKRDFSASSMSEPRAMQSRLAMNPVAGGVKLRPFVPGRKLPSRNEMQGSLSAQMPQLDNSAQPLSGTVNESAFAAHNSSTYSAPGYSSYRTEQVAAASGRNRIRQAAESVASFQRKHAVRSMPGQSPATPGQVGFPCAQQAVANINAPRQNAPTEAEWSQMAQNVGNNNASSEADDMRSLAAEFAASQPHARSTAGPAPFPLSLIPEASLKQLIGSTAKGVPSGPSSGAASGAMHSARPQQAMTPSYFGSWHKSQPVASAKAGNLQPSGFHTYLTAHGNGSKTVSASAFKTYSPLAYKSTRRAAPQIATAKKVASAPAPVVATYGAYHGAVTPL